MKIQKILTFFILFLLFASVSVNAVKINHNYLENSNIEDAELPEWSVGNYWKYYTNFNFIVRDGASKTFSVDAEINNMYATVIEIDSIAGQEVYVMAVDGYITGDLSLFSAEIDIAEIKGDFGGYAYITKNQLGMKQFSFEVDGQVKVPILGWRDMDFVMIMEFDPYFNIFDFPIKESDKPWDVHITKASLTADVDIDIPFGEQDYNSSMQFHDVMQVNRIESIDVPAGSYEAYVLNGTWGYLSNLWYSSKAGFLVKVDEALNWEDGHIESAFYLELIETNYNEENSPPNIPDKPTGPTDGITDIDYTFASRAVDVDGDRIYYLFDWGDGTDSEWLGPFISGMPVEATKRWYTKGIFNVMVKAKDETGLLSSWSEPLSIRIKGDPKVTILMHKIEKIDEIDWDPTGKVLPPEWYYTVEIVSEGTSSPPKSNYNTDDGTYEGEWFSQNVWEPDAEHEFTVSSRLLTIKLKLMDYDGGWEGGEDDLADVSGCNYPDNDGADDSTPNKRGAIYHATFDQVTGEINAYSPTPDDNSDFYYKDDGYIITSGDYAPDNSDEYESGLDPENDAIIWFRPSSDYQAPNAFAQILNEADSLRPNEEIRFSGNAQNGAPDYTWYWDFGDGSFSMQQNPSHVYTETGVYTVKLTVNDAFEQVSTYELTVDLENYNPILTNDRVEWNEDGTVQDTFTFIVHYIDSDGDNPAVKKLIIDGEEKTLSGAGSNTDYYYSILGAELGSGSHKFSFYFEDGFGGSVQTNEKTFTIKKSKIKSEFYLDFLIDIFNLFLNKLKSLNF